MSVDTQQPVALEQLRNRLAQVSLPLDIPSAEEARRHKAALIDQLDDHVLPRLRSLDAPALCVVGGSTGAGKSTLVSSLVKARVSRSGVLRPTTTSPVLVCHPDDRRWFDDDRVLPGLARRTGMVLSGSGRSDPGADYSDQVPGLAGAGVLDVVSTDHLPSGLALLDAPDIDSVVDANRELAAQLLGAADLWLFVTTAARYGDAVPWNLLGAAAARNAAVAVVLNRVPPEAATEVPAHLASMLQQRGLPDARLFTVAEVELDDYGFVPDSQLQPMRAWLGDLATDEKARAAVVRRTLEGAISSVAARAEDVAVAAEAQVKAEAGLATEIERFFGRAGEDVDRALEYGELLRREVLERLNELAGAGQFMRTVQQQVSKTRDSVVSAVTGRPKAIEQIQGQLGGEVAELVVASAGTAADQVAESWRTRPGGRQLLPDDGSLRKAAPDLPERAVAALRAWQHDVLDLVRDEGVAESTAAKWVSRGVNGAALAVMVGVFAHTGGLTGAEVAVAGGASAASTTILEAVVGDQVVRSLSKRARQRLQARTEALIDQEADRFRRRLAAAGVQDGAAGALRSDIAAVRGERALLSVRPSRRAAVTTSRAATAAGPDIAAIDGPDA